MSLKLKEGQWQSEKFTSWTFDKAKVDAYLSDLKAFLRKGFSTEKVQESDKVQSILVQTDSQEDYSLSFFKKNKKILARSSYRPEHLMNPGSGALEALFPEPLDLRDYSDLLKGYTVDDVKELKIKIDDKPKEYLVKDNIWTLGKDEKTPEGLEFNGAQVFQFLEKIKKITYKRYISDKNLPFKSAKKRLYFYIGDEKEELRFAVGQNYSCSEESKSPKNCVLVATNRVKKAYAVVLKSEMDILFKTNFFEKALKVEKPKEKKVSSFESKSATRIDLAGGTLDLWPLSTLIEGASTVNCSISCYTKVSFKPGEQFSLFVESPDFSENFSFESLESFKQAEDPKFSLLQKALSAFSGESKALGYWELKSESPAGSGLGGSSSLLISILKVIFEVEDRNFTEKEIIETAKNIESRVLKTPAGIQDYFSPVKEGLNKISYLESGFSRESLSGVLDFWKPHFTIVDSKIKHHSGMNNWEILKSYIDGELKVIGALNEIATVSKETANAIQNKNYEDLIGCFKRELEARKKVSESYINDELQTCLDVILGVESVSAAKVCGAGGGGCILTLHKPSAAESVRKNLSEQGVHVLPFELTGQT